MAFILDNQTGNITFGVVADLSHDAIARDIASEFGVSETFNDNFSTSTNFTSAGTKVTITGGVIDAVDDTDSINHSLIHDLGTPLSDTLWVMRFKITPQAFANRTGASANAIIHIGAYNANQASGAKTSQDSIVFDMRSDVGVSWGLKDTDNATLNASGHDAVSVTDIPIVSQDRFIELTRTSATTYQAKIFSDSKYTVLEETLNGVCSANTTGLQFIGVKTNMDTDATGLSDAHIDDLQIWDGITVPVITSKQWRMRFTLDITALSLPSGSDLSMWIGLTDEDETSDSTNLQDGFLFGVFVDNTLNRFIVSTPDNQAPRNAGIDKTMTTQPSVNTFFVEMQRNESQTTVIFYTDNTFTTISETQSQAGVSGSDSLKYLKIFNDVLGNNANTMDGTFDDFTFTDLTMVGAPTDKTFIVDAILEQILFTCGDKIIFQDDFTTAVNWVQTGTQVTIASGEIQGWGPDATTQRLTHDLVTPLSDKSWTAEFEFEFSAFFNPAHDIFVLTNTNGNSAVLQDHIAVRFGFSGGLIQFGLLHGGNLALGSGTIMPITASINTRYFVRLQRITLGLARLTVFTGGFDSVLFGTIDVDLTLFGGTPTGLQFIISETSVLGGASRTLTGIIDNLVLTNACCNFNVDALLKRLGDNGLCGIQSLSQLKAYWNFDESSGDLLNQASAIGSVDALTGTKGQGTVTSITQNVAGQVGTAYDFTPIVALITMQGIPSDWNFLSNNTSTWTWSCWIDPDETGVTAQTIFNDRGTALNNTGINLKVLKGATTWNTSIIIRLNTNNGFQATVTDGLGIPQDGQKHMLTITMDYAQANQNAKIYVDGVFKESLDKTNDSIGGNQFVITLGRTGGGEQYDGIMDETSVWDRILTPTEISGMFSLGNGGLPLALTTGGVSCFSVDALIKLTGDVLCGVGGPQTIFTEDFTTNAGWTYTGSFPSKLFVDGVSFPDVLRLECFRSTAVDGSQHIEKPMGITINESNFQSGDIIWEFDHLHIAPCAGFASTNSMFSLTEDSTHIGDNRTTKPHLTYRATAVTVGNPGIQGQVAEYSDGVNTIVVTAEIPLVNNTQYFPRITKFLDGTLKLEVFTDSGRTVQTAGSPVSIDASSIANKELKNIQLASVSGGGNGRRQRAEFDNVLVTQSAGCPRFAVDALVKASGDNGRCGSELKAYYKFQETSGNMSADSLGSILNAGSTSDASIDKTNTGRIGNGWKSAGILDATRISIGGNANDWNFLSTGSLSINVWLNNDPAIFNQITQIFYTSDTPTDSEDNGVSLSGDWRTNVVREIMSYRIYENDTQIYLVQSPPEFLIARDATFHMYTMVIEIGVGATFYRDGVLFGFVANTNTFDVKTAFSPPIMLNGGPDGGITEGTIFDEWSFWEGILRADKITELYNSGSGLAITQSFLDGFVDGIQRSCTTVDAKLILQPTETFIVDGLVQALGINGNCPFPATETFYSRAKSPALAERLGEGVNSPFAGITRAGVKIEGATHAGKAIEDIRVLGIRRNGVGATGTMFATVRNENDTVIATSTNSVLAQSLPTTGAGNDVTFTFDNKVVLQDGFRILLEFPNCIGCADSASEPNVFWFGTSTASPAGTSRTFFSKTALIPIGFYTETTTGFTQGATISFTTSPAEPAKQQGCADVDAFLKATQTKTFLVDGFVFILPVFNVFVDALLKAFDQEKDFTIDGCLRIETREEFEIDACLQIEDRDELFLVDALIFILPVRLFLVDAIVRYAQGTTLLGGIPDLIIRALRENPPSLTGREIVDEIVKITSDPAEGFSFRGKTSRIKNWLNRLRLDGFIIDDNSNPDWYRTNWSLDPAVFP